MMSRPSGWSTPGPRGSGGPHRLLQAVVCGGQCETLCEHDGVRMFQWRRGPGLPVFPPAQDHHEWGKIHGDASREAHLLDASSHGHALPPRLGTVPQKQKSDGISPGSEVS